jgi:hypothetical protein
MHKILRMRLFRFFYSIIWLSALGLRAMFMLIKFLEFVILTHISRICTVIFLAKLNTGF